MPSTPAPDLPRPPFIHVDGLPNFRDAGGYPAAAADPSAATSSSSPKMMVRRGILFRSSEPSKLTAEGEAKLRDLGIRQVYDLRSAVEIDRGIREGHGWQIREWDGANRNFVPVFLEQDYSPEALALRIKNYSDDSEVGFVAAYMDILHAAASKNNTFSPFRKILAHLASSPDSSSSTTSTSLPLQTLKQALSQQGQEQHQQAQQPVAPILIHCTAGKDRTGVICALVLSLCGVDDQVIADEYNLTELGLRERHDELMHHLLQNPSMSNDVAGARRMIGAQKSSILGTLSEIRQRYGSVEDCVVKLGLLTPAEITQLRRNLVVECAEDDN